MAETAHFQVAFDKTPGAQTPELLQYLQENCADFFAASLIIGRHLYVETRGSMDESQIRDLVDNAHADLHSLLVTPVRPESQYGRLLQRTTSVQSAPALAA